MRTRVITATVALLIFIPLLILGGIPLTVAISLIGIVAVSEVLMMRKRYLHHFESLISMLGAVIMILPNFLWNYFPNWLTRWNLVSAIILALLVFTVVTRSNFTFDDAGVLTLAIFYIGAGFHYFLQAREFDYRALIFALIIIWGTDIFAYLIGRSFGHHKLIPKISPNKTIEGSIGGTVVAVILATIFVIVTDFVPSGWNLSMMIILSIILSVAGQFGDLIESSLKRHYRIKDSGNILPGHGGILDRFDSLLFVMPLMAILGVIS